MNIILSWWIYLQAVLNGKTHIQVIQESIYRSNTMENTGGEEGRGRKRGEERGRRREKER